MKILILTSTENRHYYFASKITNNFKDDDVFILQEPKSSRGKNKSKLKRIVTSHRILLQY